MVVRFRSIWGGAKAAQRQLTSGWTDLLIAAGIFGLLYGIFQIAGQWHAVMRPKVEIDLSPWKLPWYTFQSLMRGMFAYVLSLLFTFVYGYWAAKDTRAEKILVPMLDILQSIPVLGFMPGLVFALVALFPHSNMGLELAAILMIFTGQVWNMTFSFYRSIQTVPREQQESARVFGFTWWQRFRHVELPFATLGLVWNSMMSMAGGWFFLMLSEAFTLGSQDFRLPGLGSYMSVAVTQHDYHAQIYAVIAMMTMVVALDQFLWRPLVAWAQKFRVEEGSSGEVATSWFLDWLRHSRLRQFWQHITKPLAKLWHARGTGKAQVTVAQAATTDSQSRQRPSLGMTKGFLGWLNQKGGAGQQGCGDAVAPAQPSAFSNLSLVLLVILIGMMVWGAWELWLLLKQVSLHSWGKIFLTGGLTFLRVAAATFLGTIWALPVGVIIGLSPRLSRICQPIIQIAASFPASMLFAGAIVLMSSCGITLGLGSIFLMLLGTQWYILFNVIAGAMTIPADLREAAHAYGISGWQRFSTLYFPAIFPYLVTGWVTAMGGAWNASIVTEYYDNGNLSTLGLGAMISKAANEADLPTLAASIVGMSTLVVIINRTLWKRLYRLSETKFSLEK